MRTERSLKRRRRQRNRRRVLILITMAVMVSVICYTVAAYGNMYQSEEDFIEFANEHFEKGVLYTAEDVVDTEYKYTTEYSFACDYNECEDADIAAFRDDKIEDIKESFKKKYAEDDEDSESDKVTKKALFIRAGVFDSGNGYHNLAIYRSDVIEIDRKMETVYEHVYTYQFSDKTGDTLVPPQIFFEDYRDFCSEYAVEHFSGGYEEDELVQDWETVLKSDKNNFNNYIITNSGVIFYFDGGTIAKDDPAIKRMKINNDTAGPILREEILQRYIYPDRPMVAVTYDDGPGGLSEDRILDCLEKYNVVATFFYQGTMIKGREDKIKRAKDLGCEIGNHSWSHPVLTSLDKKKLKSEFSKTNKAIYKSIGEYPTVFRPPYGETDKYVNKMSKLPVILWTVDTLDWKYRNGKKVFNSVKKSGNLDGDIILLHSIHNSTADATEMLIPWLKEKGYQLVTISELVKYKTDKNLVDSKVYRIIK